MNAEPHDRDQQLLEHLAAIERLAQRDQAIRGLAQTIAAELRAGQYQPAATANVTQLVAPTLPPAQQGMLLNGDALAASPTPYVEPVPRQMLADHPLVSQVVSFLPFDWQVSVSPVLSRVHFSMRTLAVLVALVLCVGFYTGHVTVPTWLREYARTCPQPQPVTQPQ